MILVLGHTQHLTFTPGIDLGLSSTCSPQHDASATMFHLEKVVLAEPPAVLLNNALPAALS